MKLMNEYEMVYSMNCFEYESDYDMHCFDFEIKRVDAY